MNSTVIFCFLLQRIGLLQIFLKHLPLGTDVDKELAVFILRQFPDATLSNAKIGSGFLNCQITFFQMDTSYFKFFILLSFESILFLSLSCQFFFSAFTVGRRQPDADPALVDLKPQTALAAIIGSFT